MAEFVRTYNALLVFMAINGVLAFSMYAVLIAGQLSLAQAAFASIAAYTSAILTMELGLPFPAVVVAGVFVGATAALLLGLPVLRLRGVFLAIATIGFGEMVRILALNMDITGGAIGLRPIPKVVTMWQAYLALGLCAYFFWRLRPSKLGRGLAALREDEVAARAMGIDIVRYKLFAFAVSGAIAGLSGVLFSHFTRFISPDQFGFERAVEALLYAVVGGTGHWLGPALGGGFLTFLPELQRQIGVEAGWLRPFYNGLILLAVVLFVPGGLVGLGRPLGLSRRLRDVPSDAVHDQARRTSENGPDASRADEIRRLVQLDRVGKEYGGLAALDDVTFTIAAGEVVGLIGPNGAGKTTLVNIVTGLTEATSGGVEVMGTRLHRTPANRVTALGVARTFQQTKLFPHLTARENVAVGGHRVAADTFLRRLAFIPSARADEALDLHRADSYLDMVGLVDRRYEPASSFSYGDQRRLEIARALCGDPALLLLDEPAAGMNHVEAQSLADLIRAIAARGVTVLLIEHNVRLVMRTCSRVLVLDFGKLIADGTPAAVARDPEVIRAYLGAGQRGRSQASGEAS